MKLSFPPPSDGKAHQYCWNCHRDGVSAQYVDGQKCWACPSCGQVNERFIGIGDKAGAVWWINQADDEIWHESAGVFVRRPDGKFLFFERTDFPKGYTIPAGHVDYGEDAKVGAIRELQEEVGIVVEDVAEIATTDIVGDSCIGGADTHRWHIYRADIPKTIDVDVKEEGQLPGWFTLAELADKPKPFAIAYILDHFAEELSRP